MDFLHLASITKIDQEKTKKVWGDFCQEVKKSIATREPFVYSDIAEIDLTSTTLHSDYIWKLLTGKTTVEKFTKEIKDERKASFAKIVYFILKEALYRPIHIKELGVFYIKGSFSKTASHPQTNKEVKLPPKIVLGFKPEFGEIPHPM